MEGKGERRKGAMVASSLFKKGSGENRLGVSGGIERDDGRRIIMSSSQKSMSLS